ncbi:MAG: condensation domain-containing protein, partial [Myxococcota bacterium]
MNDIAAFLRKLAARDIRVRCQGGKLTINAPRGALDDTLRAQLKAHKPAILAFLGDATVRDERAIPPAAGGRPERIPLSFAQERMWFLHQLDGDSAAYNVPAAFRVRGPLSRDALEQALTFLVARHESLRTTFAVHDGRPVQIIDEPRRPTCGEIDLSDLSLGERESRVAELVEQDARRPFALDGGELWRVRLLRLGPDESVLLIAMHHIISDGWSLALLFDELARSYEAALASTELLLPPLAVQYADYAIWQRALLAGDEGAKQLAYWRDALDGMPSLLEMPTDRPRPAILSDAGDIIRFQLSPADTSLLRAVASEHECTLFMVLLAAYSLLLHRYSGQDDFAVGTTIANRNQRETEGLIGFFVNALVMRCRFAEDMSVAELLRRSRATCLAAYEHQDLPFEMLVGELVSERSMAHSPLFQAMLMLQNIPGGAHQIADTSVEPILQHTGTAHFDLVLSVTPIDDGLSCELEFRSDLFDRERIERMARHFSNLAGALSRHPDQPIGQLPYLGTSEEKTVIHDWNATAAPYSRDLCLHQLFEKQVEVRPDAIALIWGQETVSYRGLNERANRVAHALLDAGLSRGEHVAIYLEHSPEMVVALMAVMKAGGT